MAATADQAISQLIQVIDRLNDADIRVAAASERAGSVHMKMVAAGFLGIAKGVADISARLHAIRVSVAGTVGASTDAISSLRAAARQTNLEQVRSQFSASISAISLAHSGVESAIDQMDQAAERSAEVLHGGQPDYLISTVQRARTATAEAAAMLDLASATTNEVLAHAMQAGRIAANPAAPSAIPGHNTGSPVAAPGRRPGSTDYEALSKWAQRCYDNIRTNDDSDKIARALTSTPRVDGTTGISAAEIREIRQHLFFDEQVLDSHDGEPPRRARFDSDEDIAAAWSRLRTGQPLPQDVVLLEHELAEARYLRDHPGATYRQAHQAANTVANWERQIPPSRREDFNTEWR